MRMRDAGRRVHGDRPGERNDVNGAGESTQVPEQNQLEGDRPTERGDCNAVATVEVCGESNPSLYNIVAHN